MRRILQHLLAVILWLAGTAALADSSRAGLSWPPSPDTPEAWLVTYGPGEIYWQRYGHNAIWLREPGGLDHVFNFGFFDFEQERFLTRFVQGRMTYFSLAQPAQQEFRTYHAENRAIRAQKLALQPGQYRRLRDYLVQEVQPDRRFYTYDYYLNNCSTRVRDALDLALGGVLSSRFSAQPAQWNQREQTRRLTSMDFWYYLGLEIALGQPVDREASRWEEMFVPGVIADALLEVPVGSASAGQPLVSADHDIYVSHAFDPPPGPPVVWWRYLALAAAALAAAWLSGRLGVHAFRRGLILAWVMLASAAGLVLHGLWWLTDHHVATANENILLFSPLFALALVPATRRVGAALLATGALTSVLLAMLPGGQYNLDVLALAAPLNLGAAFALWNRSGARPGS